MIRLAILAAFALASSPALGAERSFSVTGFDRIRVDGPYSVRLTTGVAPFARASGSPAGLDGVAIDVEGRTLVVRPSHSSWGGYPGEQSGPVEIAVGTHELGTAWLNGSGSLSISRIEGLAFDLVMQGSGSAEIADAEVDQLKVAITGAGNARIAGKAAKLTATARGTSVLDASRLKVKDATIGAEGPSQILLTVSGEVEVEAAGLASVQLAGSPACEVRARGSASVTGC